MKRSMLAALAATATLAAPAFAATDTFKLDVAYSEANLETAAGAAAEYASIRDQVLKRCDAEHADLGFAKVYAVNLCTERTLGRTVRAINHANLTAEHARNR
jgi:UrcA family protein